MKKLLATCLILTIGFTAATAQRQGGGGERMIQMYKDSLNLTDKQFDSVKAIVKDYQSQRREIMMDQEMSREDKMAKSKPITEARNSRLKNVLTADQYAKFQDMEKKMMERMRQGGGGMRGAGGPPPAND
jgi:Spy/CpxP family protein refolding chaperone